MISKDQECYRVITSYCDYKDLSIHERINLRSGFDVAVASEKRGETSRIGKCVSMNNLNRNCCQEEYDIDRFYVSLRTLY